MKIDDLISCYRHKKTRTRYHLILVTKYRRKCITPDVKDSFITVFRECESKISSTTLKVSMVFILDFL